MHAYGYIAHIDLTTGKVRREPAENYARDIGGRGRNVALLRELVPPGADALGPENVLIFGTGPVTGTLAPASSRYNVTAKSPLSGFLGDSNSGGFWAAELKYAGYEGLVFYGKAAKPVYLWIDDDQIEIRDAAGLWGQDTWQTASLIRSVHRDPRVAVNAIGPAGENLVKFACIVNDGGRVAGRTGMGAVMGSKNLKAIAVRGTKGIRVAHPKEYFETCQRIAATIRGGRQFDLYKMSGVVAHRGIEDYSDDDPIVNLLFEPPMPGWGEIGGKEWWRTYWTKRKACSGCQMHCSHFYVVRDGPFAGVMGEGPDAETQGWLTVLVGNSKKEIAAFGNGLLNRLGMDAIEMGAIVRGVMKCYDRGVLTDDILKKLGARWLRPHWGDIEALLTMIQRTAGREGIGNILADGPYPTAEAIGGDAHYWIDTCKGMSELNRSPQKGGVLNHMVSNRGPDHLRGSPSLEFYGYTGDQKIKADWNKYIGEPELFDYATQLTSYKGKPPLVIWQEHLRALSDSFGVCSFNYGNWPNTSIYPEDFAELYTYSTGIEVSAADMVAAAERTIANEKAFNIFQGWTRADDQPPRLWVEEIKQSGLYKGEHTDINKFNLMLDEYYTRRGWDGQTGLPGREKLNALGLADLADELAAIGKLSEDASA
jgi:aldehyde:ferredoxin oxidoreductase